MEYDCVKIFIMNEYISESYTTTKNAIDRQYLVRGSCSVNYLTIIARARMSSESIAHEAEGRMGY